jgi:hypothetical protein
VATALADALELDLADQRTVYHASLLMGIGCTAHAPENASMFEDDMAFAAALRVLDAGDPVVMAEQMGRFGAWASREPAGVLAARFAAAAPTVGPVAGRASCEVSAALGGQIGLPASAIAALDDVHERWDGLGLPDGRSGEQLTLAGRIVHVAEQAVIADTLGGRAAARAEVARRAGGSSTQSCAPGSRSTPRRSSRSSTSRIWRPPSSAASRRLSPRSATTSSRRSQAPWRRSPTSRVAGCPDTRRR